jgi:hypothetical protein
MSVNATHKLLLLLSLTQSQAEATWDHGASCEVGIKNDEDEENDRGPRPKPTPRERGMSPCYSSESRPRLPGASSTEAVMNSRGQLWGVALGVDSIHTFTPRMLVSSTATPGQVFGRIG